VRLLTTDEDLSDFFFPNGGFTGKTFEVLSYRSDVRRVLDSTIYMRPPTALPPSETEGLPNLEPIGNVFTNVPPVSPGYVERSELESELRSVLMNERHPVVTLMGRGGIGKTSVALKVLQALAYEERFFAVLWFSARDIDLRAEGPKVVRPQVLTQGDIAKEFCRLMDAGAVEKKGHRPLEHLGESMQDTEHAPLLFVFDNFETVRNPEEVYTWMDTYIRPPNKILITTRHRSFKGDYPLDVPGMSEEEFERLVRQTSSLLGIQRLVTGEYLRNLFVESGGHPYVVKILLGELARAGRPRKIDRIMADQDDILDALFERTFEGLPAVAKRIYLTLCNWRSVIPMLALEATLLRPTHERIDVGGALETLERTSLVERVTSGRDSSEFLMVPLASYLYGKRKIAVSPMKSVIDVDTAVLQRFGAARESDVRHGVGPRIDRFFRSVATGLSDGALQWSDYLPVLVYVSRKYPKAWLLLANLYVEHQSGKALDDAVECVRKYLEHFPHDPEAWHRLARLSQMKQDYLGEATALIHVAGLPGVTYAELSEIAVRINEMLGQRKVILYLAERRALIEPLIDVLSAREREANATDYSRIAWLQLQINQESEAKRFVLRGLRKDSSNVHCRRLAARLSLKV
jgi:hypothetical protein